MMDISASLVDQYQAGLNDAAVGSCDGAVFAVLDQIEAAFLLSPYAGARLLGILMVTPPYTFISLCSSIKSCLVR